MEQAKVGYLTIIIIIIIIIFSLSGFLALFLVFLAFIKNPDAAAVHDLVVGSRMEVMRPIDIQDPCIGKRCVLVPQDKNHILPCDLLLKNAHLVSNDLCMRLSTSNGCYPSPCLANANEQ